MSKRLKSIIIVFFMLLLVFIGTILISEHINMKKIRVEYPNIVEGAYNLRKDSLRVWGIRLILQFLLPLLFLTSRLSYRIRYLVEGNKSLFFTGVFYGIIFLTMVFLINLPLNYYSSYYLSHKYGLSNQTFGRWMEVTAKNFLINDLILSLFIFIPFYLMNKSPKIWWLKLSFLIIPVIIFMVFISPFVIDPIFNQYTTIENEKLGKEITALLHKADIQEAKIYKVDKSTDTNTMNAYMTGIFNSKRIVLWDTTINRLDEKEILSITAHEIGHYVEGHIGQSILLSSFGTILILFLVHMTSTKILDLSNGCFGIRKMQDIAIIPLLLLVFNFYSFIGMPLTNYFSRRMEVEADAYELILTEDRGSAISAMEKLYEESLGLPRPSKIYEIWYFTHPTLENRIEFYKNYPLD